MSTLDSYLFLTVGAPPTVKSSLHISPSTRFPLTYYYYLSLYTLFSLIHTRDHFPHSLDTHTHDSIHSLGWKPPFITLSLWNEKRIVFWKSTTMFIIIHYHPTKHTSPRRLKPSFEPLVFQHLTAKSSANPPSSHKTRTIVPPPVGNCVTLLPSSPDSRNLHLRRSHTHIVPPATTILPRPFF